jgi:hypothetical protein
VVLDFGYSETLRSFSRYRTFSRDAITKRAGQSYETDAEFYGPNGDVHLQIEAKASPRATDHLAGEIERHGDLSELPVSLAKEIEYVLDIAPRYLWIVGPGSVDPARHVFGVTLNGRDARFTRLSTVPPPPTVSAGRGVGRSFLLHRDQRTVHLFDAERSNTYERWTACSWTFEPASVITGPLQVLRQRDPSAVPCDECFPGRKIQEEMTG